MFFAEIFRKIEITVIRKHGLSVLNANFEAIIFESALMVLENFVHALVFAAKDFPTVQNKVAELIKGRILVGHALHNDLKVLLIKFFFWLVVWSMNVRFLSKFSS